MIKTISLQLANFLAENSSHEPAVIAYGIEVVIRALIKIIIILGLASFFGMQTITLIVMIACANFRLVSGGAHCTSYFKCLTTSLFVFLGLAYFVELFVSYFQHANVLLVLATSWIVTASITLIWAPLGNANRPLQNPEQRKLFKLLSLIYVTVAFGGATLYFLAVFEPQLRLIYAMAFGLLWQAFTVTPVGQKTFVLFETLFTFRKEVPKHA